MAKEVKVKNGFYIEVVDGVEKEHGFSFRTDLTASKKISFVNGIVDTLVGDFYNGIIKDMIFDYMIVKVFTDVDLDYMREMSDELPEIESLLERTNIVEIVKKNAKAGLIDSLRVAVDEGIEFKTGIRPNVLMPIATTLSSVLKTFESKVNEINVDEMSKLASVMSGITGELTPEKLLEAYAKSDIFVGNRAEREEILASHTKNEG